MFYDIFVFFPEKISNILKKNIVEENEKESLEEIRIRLNQKIILKFNNIEKIIDYIITSGDIIETLQRICENSIYSYQKEICEGFITIKGGHRVGVCGSTVIENRKNYKYKLYF